MSRTLALLVWAASLATAAAADPDADALRRLADLLAHPSYETRQSATRELLRAGEPALEELTRVLAGPEAEARRRAADLIDRISQRVESARLLTGTPVRLKFDRVHVLDALQELSARSGVSVTLSGGADRLGERRISLNTGRATFFEALDQLTRAAGLQEGGPQPAAPVHFGTSPISGLPPMVQPARVAVGAPAPVVPPQPAAQWRGRVQVVPGVPVPPLPVPVPAVLPPGNVVVRRPTPSLTPLVTSAGVVLRDGRAADEPTWYAGAVRVRLEARPAAADGETRLVLKVATEPHLGWVRSLGVQVDRAATDDGRDLVHLADAPTPLPVEGEAVVFNNGNAVIVRPSYRYAAAGPATPAEVEVRFEKPAGVARLAELRGSFQAQVRVAGELARVDDVMSARGAVEGKSGVTLAVTAAERNANGDTTVTAELRYPDGVRPAAPAKVGTVTGSGPVGTLGLRMLDAAGKPYEFLGSTTVRQTYSATGTVAQMRLAFSPGKANPNGPVSLAFTGTRVTDVEVPFRFENVTLR